MPEKFFVTSAEPGAYSGSVASGNHTQRWYVGGYIEVSSDETLKQFDGLYGYNDSVIPFDLEGPILATRP